MPTGLNCFAVQASFQATPSILHCRSTRTQSTNCAGCSQLLLFDHAQRPDLTCAAPLYPPQHTLSIRGSRDLLSNSNRFWEEVDNGPAPFLVPCNAGHLSTTHHWPRKRTFYCPVLTPTFRCKAPLSLRSTVQLTGVWPVPCVCR